MSETSEIQVLRISAFGYSSFGSSKMVCRLVSYIESLLHGLLSSTVDVILNHLV